MYSALWLDCLAVRSETSSVCPSEIVVSAGILEASSGRDHVIP